VWVLAGYCAALRAASRMDRLLRNTLSLAQESLLYLAVRGNMADVVEQLFDTGCRVNGRSNGSTALHAAVYYGHAHLAHYLVSRGADPHLPNSSGHTPVQEAPTRALRASMLAVARRPVPAFIRMVLGTDERGGGGGGGCVGTGGGTCAGAVTGTGTDADTNTDTDGAQWGMSEVQHIRHGGRVVAFRMARAMDETQRRNIAHNWYVAWHGTRVRHVRSILQHGLCRPGTRVGGGMVVWACSWFGRGWLAVWLVGWPAGWLVCSLCVVLC
jgi:hypothetical protein